jgi:hypothetical protein
MPKELEPFVSSSVKHSVTRYIQPIPLEFRDENGNK